MYVFIVCIWVYGNPQICELRHYGCWPVCACSFVVLRVYTCTCPHSCAITWGTLEPEATPWSVLFLQRGIPGISPNPSCRGRKWQVWVVSCKRSLLNMHTLTNTHIWKCLTYESAILHLHTHKSLSKQHLHKQVDVGFPRDISRALSLSAALWLQHRNQNELAA